MIVRGVQILCVLVVTIAGAAMLVVGADAWLLRSSTATAWVVRPVGSASNEEIDWWMANVGSILAPADAVTLTPPGSVRARDGSASAAPGVPGGRFEQGLYRYHITTPSSRVRGSVLISPATHAWRLGVHLPGGVAIERRWVGSSNAAPPLPSTRNWIIAIAPTRLALNTLYASIPLVIVVMLTLRVISCATRRVRGILRRANGRCGGCGVVLADGQYTCPECGAEPPLSRVMQIQVTGRAARP